MTPWPVRDTFDVAVVGKRLAALLLAVAIYYLATGYAIQSWNLPALERGAPGSLINTVLLGLLMGFRNRAAYQRWWEARGLWGRLVNDSRNLAAKLSALVGSNVPGVSRAAAVLVCFPKALNLHLRGEPLRLRELPGFEQDDADPAHLPIYLARQLFTLLASWKREGHIDGDIFRALDFHACALLDVCGACEKIRNTPLSPSYKGLLRAGLALNVLAAPWILVPQNGLGSLVVVLLACFFLFGVEVLDSIIEEPFGRDRDDLDLDRYCDTIRGGVEASLPPASP